MINKRNSIYRNELMRHWERQSFPRHHYLSANLALEELRDKTMKGVEPTAVDFDSVTWRFDNAIVSAQDEENISVELHSRLLHSFVRPMVWADVINIGSLRRGESRRVHRIIGLDDAVDATAEIATGALEIHRQLRGIAAGYRTPKQQTDLSDVTGFLQEVTPHLLFGRHATTKIFTTPVTEYEDSLEKDISLHIDNRLFDNRVSRTAGSYGYQIKTETCHRTYDPSVPVLFARDLGNNVKSSYWPNDDESFTTLRMLIQERGGKLETRHNSSQLDRIMNDVFKKITLKPEKKLTSSAVTLLGMKALASRMMPALSETDSL